MFYGPYFYFQDFLAIHIFYFSSICYFILESLSQSMQGNNVYFWHVCLWLYVTCFTYYYLDIRRTSCCDVHYFVIERFAECIAGSLSRIPMSNEISELTRPERMHDRTWTCIYRAYTPIYIRDRMCALRNVQIACGMNKLRTAVKADT